MQIHRDQSSDGVLTLTLDDGAKNALTEDAFDDLAAAFDEHADAQAIVLAGREGIFTAGLDTKFLAAAGRDGIHDLLVAFGRTLMRVWTDGRPVTCAATGHAIAAGTMLAMASDHAVAAEGEFRWGLTETRIDFEMPHFGIALARHNVRSDRLEDLLLPGAVIDPAAAVEVGFADELAPPDAVLARAQAKAAELAELPARAYAGTKQRLRGMSADAVMHGLDDDISVLLAHMPE